MNSVDRSNLFEIGLWAVLALCVALFGHRTNALPKTGRIILCIALLAFAYSDFVELQTGAWWRPWWLLLLKGTCLACFAGIAWTVWMNTNGKSTANPPHRLLNSEDTDQVEQSEKNWEGEVGWSARTRRITDRNLR